MTLSERDEEWTVAPLSAEDERLVNAYKRFGTSVDDLAYTEAFENMCRELSGIVDRSVMHDFYRRLLSLRKQGRLPRLHNFVVRSEAIQRGE